MSALATSTRSTSVPNLDRAIAELREHARTFARLSARSRADLLRRCIPRAVQVAPQWSAEALRVKGLPPDAAEEWLSGPIPLVRHLRLLVESLDAIAVRGRPPLGTRARTRDDGRLEVDVFPGSALDAALYRGFRAHVVMQEGVDDVRARQQQAEFYSRSDPDGAVAVVLGAGNVSSIAATDALTKMFNEGQVCLLKMNPVNEWAGPYLERVLDPLIAAGFLRVVYGGADVGHHVVNHPGVDSVHLTGSATTHDAIVWGPAGPAQEERRTARAPLLGVPITSELGNVSPVVVVPHHYDKDQLAFQARNVATMVANNASFNCVSAKMIVTGSGWPQREEFLDLVGQALSRLPARLAYYPGAASRYDTLTAERSGLQTFGDRSADALPWALVRDVDPAVADDPLFRVEPFCSLVSETSVGSTDPVQFLDAATRFLNDTLWGTLSACIVVHPELEADPAVSTALDSALRDLRYGNVAINHWPAVSFVLMSLPWGGHPSSSLADVQSGMGWVHNTYMLGEVEKVVLRGPLRVRPAPVWFSDNAKATRVGPPLIAMEAKPSWLKVPGLLRRTL